MITVSRSRKFWRFFFCVVFTSTNNRPFREPYPLLTHTLLPHSSPPPPLLTPSRIMPALFSLRQQCFVVLDDSGICGYVVAAQDAKKFINMTEMSWIPEMCLKYPKNTFEITETIAGATESSFLMSILSF